MASVWVLGSGGREHALAWKLAQSSDVDTVYCSPGNAGTQAIAQNIVLDISNHQAVIAQAQSLKVDLVVIGPEALLVDGLADSLEKAGILCFGPSAMAAQLEASKAFTKDICANAHIPTADWKTCHTAKGAREVLDQWGAPIVVKADGLAAGKGVVVAQTAFEAEQAIAAMMEDQCFGEAAHCVVMEECLVGKEASLFVLCDGNVAIPLGLARDHKRIGDNDTGANTGGMGCFTPIQNDHADQLIIEETMTNIIRPTLKQMAEDGIPFRGVLFAGLMLTKTGVKLIEYNVRFGDPECQALMCRLQSDIYPLLLAASRGTLDEVATPCWNACSVVNVVLSASGYPAQYEKNLPLPETYNSDDIIMFHAGTKRMETKELVSSGGRVVNICAKGADLEQARKKAYQAVLEYGWKEGYYRRDIGVDRKN